MTALDNAPAKALSLGNTGERDDDHARSEVFSVPPKMIRVSAPPVVPQYRQKSQLL